MSYDPSIIRYVTVVVVEGEGLAPEGQAHILGDAGFYGHCHNHNLNDFLLGKSANSPRPSTFGLVKQKSGSVGSRASYIMHHDQISHQEQIAYRGKPGS